MPARTRRLAGWRAELAEALTMAVDHLSLYQLTIEDGTAFGARAAAGGLRGLPDDDLAADLYAADAGAVRGGRDAGLRGLQPRRGRAPSRGTT